MTQDNKLIWILFRSLLILCGVSSILGIGIGIISHSWINGIIMFIISIVAQFAIHSMLVSMTNRKNQTTEFLAEQVLREASERQMPFDLNCAYCNTLNHIGISFNSENIFNCASCQQPNKVYIQFSTVRITTPLSPKEKIPKYIDIDDEPDAGITQSTINEPIKLNEK